MATRSIRDTLPPDDLMSGACPCCGQYEWKSLGERLLLLVSRPDLGDSLIEQRDGIEAVAFICQGCSFIRLQATDH